MLLELIKIYDIGKELGLTKKEISKILLFDNSKHAELWRVFLIIFMLIFLIGWYNSLTFLISKINENVYPANAMYSSIKVKDFKRKFH